MYIYIFENTYLPSRVRVSVGCTYVSHSYMDLDLSVWLPAPPSQSSQSFSIESSCLCISMPAHRKPGVFDSCISLLEPGKPDPFHPRFDAGVCI